MTTLPHRSIRKGSVSLIAVASLAMACDAMGEQTPAQQEPVTAVLKMREADFVYRTSLNYMSCDEIRNGVAIILRSLGARDDVQVRLSNCSMNGAPDLVVSGGGSNSGGFPQSQSGTWSNNTWDRSSRQQSPMERMRTNDGAYQQSTPVHIYAMMPVPADSKVMKEIEKDKSRRELISRVTGNMNVALQDPILFAATRQQVTLSHETIKLGPEHCELLDQMITHVFRDYDLKTVRKSLSCDPHQRSNIPPNAVVEALLPVGYVMPGSNKEKKPAKKDPEPPPAEQQEQPAQPAPQEQPAQPQQQPAQQEQQPQ
jgi:hypothetical protein